ncbi:SCG1 protein, partial [Nothoprocta pentlandii]|nr:SCG1 protein [Nothoprocta pentlandii]
KTQLSHICLCSGTMEGKWTSPSPHSEESSILDLPSACDLAENFLPSHSTENSEEPCFFVDTPPSPPTGVSAVPADKARIEEMVTECIVEVLSNALSKPNAPPINPECKEILRKSGKNDREQNGDKQVEMRHLREPAENEEHHAGSVEKEQGQTEMESKTRRKGSDERKLDWEEDKSEEEEDGRDISVQEAREDERQMEEMRHHQEAREDGNSYYREDRSKESRHRDEEAERAVPNKKSAGTEESPDGNDQHATGWAHPEERTQSPGKRIHEDEEGEAERSAGYRHESEERDSSHQRPREDSVESEEAAEGKEAHRAERYHRKHRMDDSQEERAHSGEKGKLAEEANEEEGRPWDRRNRHRHRQEPERQREERRGESEEEKRDSDWGGEEHGERSQEEGQRHRQSEEKWQEERRAHDGSREAARQRAEGRTYGEGGEGPDRYHKGGSEEEEEEQHRSVERHRLQDSEDEEMQKVSIGESREQVRRHYSTEDRESAEQHHDPGDSEEEEEDHSSEQIRNAEEGRLAERGQYKGRFPADTERGAAALYGPLRSLLRWKSHRLEKKEHVGQQLPESKGEAGPARAEGNLFPEYDYDWWERKQILDALNHGRAEKRNLGKGSRFDAKRQYNRMDELAQLLDFRKKAAEFPELYDSGEDIKKRHGIRNDRGDLRQRPLTQEEEKELENLAAMDLELQKIAEKLNDKRRG